MSYTQAPSFLNSILFDRRRPISRLDLKPSHLVKKLNLKQTVPDVSGPLPRQAAVRGPYTNTGSRDVGPDPSFNKGSGK